MRIKEKKLIPTQYVEKDKIFNIRQRHALFALTENGAIRAQEWKNSKLFATWILVLLIREEQRSRNISLPIQYKHIEGV